MSRPNRGKDWEDKFKNQWREIFPQELILRLKDDTSGYRGSSKNPCDFICHLGNTVFMIECKCCYDNTFNFSKLTQYDDMITYKDFNHTRCGVVLWFMDHDEVLYIPIETIQQMKRDGCKSVHVKKLDGYDLIHIPHYTSRVFPKCDYTVLEKLVYED